MTQDVIVIGGGLIGMLTARELCLSGLKVTLLEQGGQVGQESSWAGGGIISPTYPWHYLDEINALTVWSHPRYRDLCQQLKDESGVDSEWTLSGLLILDIHNMSEAQRWAQRWQMALEILDQSGLSQLEKDLKADFSAWLPEIAQVRNPRLVRALGISLRKLGVEIKEKTKVTGLLVRDQAITAVVTQVESITTDKVVIAGGAWSGQILANIDVHLPVEPARGQMIVFSGPPGLLSKIIVWRGYYLIPRQDGHILAGSTVEYVGFDKSTTKEALAELFNVAYTLVPALKSLPIKYQWAGLRPGSPQGVPCISKHPWIKGLYINAGHFRNGIVAGPASARLLADILLKRDPILNPAPYALTAFM
ncbi:glycine oxidase ThiO [Candidatus Nitrosoglobus terrae]|uniref:Glycine oxidase ThiO n=1 Tax=Candidatus Nitrosoglobus terrae TaxID=1630141 RepID=A0A1Q2SM27_9GAMM|nr:glycine oxidase ThiO [Candidatus Nitrosoglobus terrae]BAW80195.1 glycine oxidase ThiO [Candidatus Nitrosoglobus terrae]